VNEAFRVRLVRDGQFWPITSLSSDGIVLSNERDAFPRTLALEFDARSQVTAYRMNRVRQLNGWSPWTFQLHGTLADGAFYFTGSDPMSLPSGNYWARITVTDLKTSSKRLSLDINDGQADAVLEAPVQTDSRSIGLTTPFNDFDPEILAVLQASGSVIDGVPIDRWLASTDPRANRKACLLNLMAKLRTAPTPKAPLISYVIRVFFVGTERVYGEVRSELFPQLQALAADPEKPFYYEGRPTSPMHLKLLERIEAQGWGQASNYQLHSFRQEGKPSMQAVVAVPDGGSGSYFADFDIDLGNPLQDADGFIIHMGELASGAPTDHLGLRAKLAKGSLKEFLYYRVVAAA
jgi:hypothetical protein